MDMILSTSASNIQFNNTHSGNDPSNNQAEESNSSSSSTGSTISSNMSSEPSSPLGFISPQISSGQIAGVINSPLANSSTVAKIPTSVSPVQSTHKQCMNMQQTSQLNSPPSQTLPSTLSGSKKSTSGGSDEIQTFHAHVEDERVLEYDPTGRYGKLNVILGKGAYKIVWKALDFKDGYEVAWNCFQTSKQESTELCQEIEILKQVRHPNIITFRDAWYNNGEFVFITELITSGTLREYVQKLKKPDLKIVRSWARQILNGLLYLHTHNPPIIHRDIKCDNIFINGAHGEVKIGDMGTAKMKVGKKYTVIGTPEFMAPEMYEEKGYSEKVDVYAFGMCLLEMVTAEYPYSECKNAAQIYKKVSSGIKPECLSRVTDDLVLSLIQKCITVEAERLSVRDIIENPFFACEPELVLLCINEATLTLTLQVVIRGPGHTSFKFEFNLENDTAEEVVSEMIEEQVVSEIYRTHLTSQLNKQIRHFHQTFPLAMETASSRKIQQQQHAQQVEMGQLHQQTQIDSDSTSIKEISSTIISTINTTTPLLVSNEIVSQLPQYLTSNTPQLPGTIMASPIPIPSLSTNSFSSYLASLSLQSDSLLSWKREGQYKAELTLAQKEALLAMERAINAEKRASEIETLMKVEEIKQSETELVIENLKSQIASLKQHQQQSSPQSSHQQQSSSPSSSQQKQLTIQRQSSYLQQPAVLQSSANNSQQIASVAILDDSSKNFNTVLEQPFMPSSIINSSGTLACTGHFSNRSNSPKVITSSPLTLGDGATSSPSTSNESFIPQQQQNHQHPTHQGSSITTTATSTQPSSINGGMIIQPTSSISSLSISSYLSDSMNIEEFVTEVAFSSQRSPEKAYEWISKLQTQDIITVGDLRQLHDADWSNLNLTVFATRALKNALSRRYPQSGGANKLSSTTSLILPYPTNNEVESQDPIQHMSNSESVHLLKENWKMEHIEENSQQQLSSNRLESSSTFTHESPSLSDDYEENIQHTLQSRHQLANPSISAIRLPSLDNTCNIVSNPSAIQQDMSDDYANNGHSFE